MKNKKWDGCIVVAAVGGGDLAAIRCDDRADADKMAKAEAENGVEVAVYQLVGVWKPKTMPVEFVTMEQPDKQPDEFPKRSMPKVPAEL